LQPEISITVVRFHFLIFLIILPNLCLPQSATDSLLKELARTADDTSKVKIYLLLRESTLHHTDSSRRFIEKARYHAGKSKDIRFISRAEIALSDWYCNHASDFDSALIIARRVLSRNEKAGYKQGIANACRMIGRIYLWNSLDSAMYYFLKSIELSQSINDFANAAKARVSLANVYAEMGRLDDAIQEALGLVEDVKRHNLDKVTIAIAYVNIGEYYQRKGDLKKAIEYTMLSKKYNISNPHNDGYYQCQLAGILVLDKKFNEAEKLYKAAIESGLKNEIRGLLSMANNGMANLAYERKKWDDVIKYKTTAFDYYYKDKKFEADMHRMISEAYYHKGMFKESLERFKKYIAVRDSFEGADRLKKADEMEAIYRNKEKQASIELLNSEKELHKAETRRHKLLRNAALLITLLFIFTGWMIFNRFKLKKKIEQQQMLLNERKRISTEMHDELGSEFTKINLLSEVIRQDLNGGTGDSARKISEAAQEALNKMGEIVWSLNPRNDFIDNFVSYLRKYAAEYFESTGMKYHFHLKDSFPHAVIDGIKRRHIFLAFKEALHNITRHAQASETYISFTINEGKLLISIRDNGKGIDMANGNSFGNGIINMKERMQQAGGSFEISNHQGTMVSLSVPL
jgi:signal transduction histidine kinase